MAKQLGACLCGSLIPLRFVYENLIWARKEGDVFGGKKHSILRSGIAGPHEPQIRAEFIKILRKSRKGLSPHRSTTVFMSSLQAEFPRKHHACRKGLLTCQGNSCPRMSSFCLNNFVPPITSDERAGRMERVRERKIK